MAWLNIVVGVLWYAVLGIEVIRVQAKLREEPKDEIKPWQYAFIIGMGLIPVIWFVVYAFLPGGEELVDGAFYWVELMAKIVFLLFAIWWIGKYYWVFHPQYISRAFRAIKANIRSTFVE